MCNDRDGNLLTDQPMVASRRMGCFEAFINGKKEDIVDDGQAVKALLLNEFKNDLNWVKNNMVAGKDSI